MSAGSEKFAEARSLAGEGSGLVGLADGGSGGSAAARFRIVPSRSCSVN
jgi:hypothetical protein